MPKNKQIDDTTKPGREEKSWAEDIEKHDYYYDDSHGYEVYIDDDDDDEKKDREDEWLCYE
jgi:hypothetical protein